MFNLLSQLISKNTVFTLKQFRLDHQSQSRKNISVLHDGSNLDAPAGMANNQHRLLLPSLIFLLPSLAPQQIRN
jgi:hypothetical protein